MNTGWLLEQLKEHIEKYGDKQGVRLTGYAANSYPDDVAPIADHRAFGISEDTTFTIDYLIDTT